jgi:hypothetical protein
MQADHQDEILRRLSQAPHLDSQILQQELGLTHEALYRELVSLVAIEYVRLENKKVTRFILTPEGKTYAEKGTP